MRCVLGFDGGGTKTECVLVDEMGEVRGRAAGGPSNPVNVGVEAAAAELAKAGREALKAGGFTDSNVAGILGGIAGAGEPNERSGLQEILRMYFPNASVSITSDLVLSLAATGESPSVVVLAGTGSAVLGRTPAAKFARAGGFGPIIGDPGSAYDLGRRTIALALQRHLDSREFAMKTSIVEWAKCSLPDLADRARQNPTKIFPALFPLVADAAEKGDEDATGLLQRTAQELFSLAENVITQLKIQNVNFFIGKTGGVFVGSPLVGTHFDMLVKEFAPLSRVGALPRSIAETAAHLAYEVLRNPIEFIPG